MWGRRIVTGRDLQSSSVKRRSMYAGLPKPTLRCIFAGDRIPTPRRYGKVPDRPLNARGRICNSTPRPAQP
jgi:hypothetical protein